MCYSTYYMAPTQPTCVPSLRRVFWISLNEYNSAKVSEVLQTMRPRRNDSVNMLRIKFFMLLCENEDMKKKLSNKTQQKFIVPLCVEKARLFYDELCDELIPEFLQATPIFKKTNLTHEQDETITFACFVDKLRASYLHC